MSERGRVDLLEVREGSGGPPGGPRSVRRPYQRSERPSRRFGRPFRRSARGREGLPEVWEGLKGPCRSVRHREDLPEVRERLGGPPGGLGGVRRLFQKFGRGREAFPEVRKGSE